MEIRSDAPSFKTEPAAEGDDISREELPGTYMMNGSSTVFEFIESEGELYLRRFGRNDIRLVQEASNIYHQWNDSAFKQEFTTNAKGELQITAYYTTHAPYKLTKVFADLSGTQPEIYAGSFVNEETGATINIEHLSDVNFRLTVSDQSSYDAMLIKSDLMVAGSIRIIFSHHQTGNIERFFLNEERIKDVEFVRVGSDN